MAKLTSTDRHFLHLVVKDRQEDGWTPVSSVVYPMVDAMPKELIELERHGDGGRVRLTPQGQSVFDAIAWLI